MAAAPPGRRALGGLAGRGNRSGGISADSMTTS
jgi:hypothetical protein